MAVSFESLPFFLGAAVVGWVCFLLFSREYRVYPGFPLVGASPKSWNKVASARKAFVEDGLALVHQALKDYPGPFQVATGTGTKIVLPNRYAEEIKNIPHLSSSEVYATELLSQYRAFEPYAAKNIDVCSSKPILKMLLNYGQATIDDLVDETADAIPTIFGDRPEWQRIPFRPQVLRLISRLTTRVFLSKEMARDSEWLQIAEDYYVDSFVAVRMLRYWPPFLQPLAYWLSPQCRKLRNKFAMAGELLRPLEASHLRRRRKALEAGLAMPEPQDTVGMMLDATEGQGIDIPCGQLFLTAASLHTTTELVTQTIFELAGKPHLIDALRQEVISVVGGPGITKASLYQLKLMDSLLKEVQRLHPMDVFGMQRVAHEEIVLSDGSTIPRGAKVAITMETLMDPSVFPDPQKFDPYRFVRLREGSGQENSWQFASTSSEHLGFGYGLRACPGRFFAAHEAKIILCHLLLKYDWRVVADDDNNVTFGTEFESSPDAEVMFRRRAEELSL